MTVAPLSLQQNRDENRKPPRRAARSIREWTGSRAGHLGGTRNQSQSQSRPCSCPLSQLQLNVASCIPRFAPLVTHLEQSTWASGPDILSSRITSELKTARRVGKQRLLSPGKQWRTSGDATEEKDNGLGTWRSTPGLQRFEIMVYWC